MAVTYTALRAEERRIAPFLIPRISTFTSNGTTAYGIDTAMWTDVSAVALTAKSASGMYLLRPTAVAAGDRVRRVTGNSGSPLDLTNARIYVDRVWTNAPTQGEVYELHSIDPNDEHDLRLMSLESFLIPAYAPLGPASQGDSDWDMHETGATNYTVSGAGSATKVTTVANVDFGIQSLFFNAGTASENVKTVTSRVTPGQTYFASAIYRVDVGGPAYFVLWDETNNAEIENSGRIGHSLEQFMSVQRTFTTPETCEEISRRIYVTGNTDDVYIAAFTRPVKASDRFAYLPSYVTRDVDFRKLYFARYAQPVNGTGGTVYDFQSRYFSEDWHDGHEFNTRFNLQDANPGRIENPRGSWPMQEAWVEVIRKESEVTALAFTAAGETSPTTNLPKHHLALENVRRICESILSYRPDDAEVKRKAAELNNPAGELQELWRAYRKNLETVSYAPQTRLRHLTRV